MKEGCTPLLEKKNFCPFFGWKINLSFKTKTILDQAICFFSSLSRPSVPPRATDARAQEATRELSLLTGKGKNRFCSYLGKVLPFIFAVAMIIYIFGRYKCYAVCLCDWEGTREFAERGEKRAQSAQMWERRTQIKGRKQTSSPPLKLAQNNSLGFLHRLENNARKKWRARPSRDWSMSNRIAWKHRYHFSKPNDSFRVWVRVDFRPSRAGRDYQKQTGRKNIVVSHIPVKNKIQNPFYLPFFFFCGVANVFARNERHFRERAVVYSSRFLS